MGRELALESSFSATEIERVYGGSFIGGNSVELLTKGRTTFRKLFNIIWHAEKFICLHFYIFRNDETGSAFANILKKKAAQGVRVYLLYDFHGSLATPRKFWRKLTEAGVHVAPVRPFSLAAPGQYLRRDHRKVMIIDGHLAFIGGMNIGNEYRGILRKIRKKKKLPWRDTGILIKGPASAALMDTFKKAWTASSAAAFEFDVPKVEESGNLRVIPIFAHSARGRRRMRRLLYYSINHARASILLTTAYFIPSRRMLETLEAAVARGVDVRLLVPGRSDVKAAHYAGRAFFSRLLRAGVAIYSYRGAMLHAKTYIFDGQWCIVGSANLDPRSLRWNDEGNAGILDEKFAEQLEQSFYEDLNHSRKIELESWRKRPLYEKLIERFFSLFRRRL